MASSSAFDVYGDKMSHYYNTNANTNTSSASSASYVPISKDVKKSSTASNSTSSSKPSAPVKPSVIAATTTTTTTTTSESDGDCVDNLTAFSSGNTSSRYDHHQLYGGAVGQK